MFGSLSNRQMNQNVFSSTAFSNSLNMSPEPSASKAYDLPQLTGTRNASRGQLYGIDLLHRTTVGDTKQGKDQRRWEIVLNKKNANTETKQRQI